MANPSHVEIIYQGVDVWNQWREKHSSIDPDLSGANLAGLELYEVNFDTTDLQGANLTGANLREANITYADFTAANLIRADFSREYRNRGGPGGGSDSVVFNSANLTHANLTNNYLAGVDFNSVSLKGAVLSNTTIDFGDLSGADLTDATLFGAQLSKTKLIGTIFNSVIISGTSFSDLDFSESLGLDTVIHDRPSRIDIATLYQSKGKIPEVLFRACGVPFESLIAFEKFQDAMRIINH